MPSSCQKRERRRRTVGTPAIGIHITDKCMMEQQTQHTARRTIVSSPPTRPACPSPSQRSSGSCMGGFGCCLPGQRDYWSSTVADFLDVSAFSRTAEIDTQDTKSIAFPVQKWIVSSCIFFFLHLADRWPGRIFTCREKVSRQYFTTCSSSVTSQYSPCIRTDRLERTALYKKGEMRSG